MKTFDLKRSAGLACLTVACVTLVSACAPYDPVVHRSTTTTPVSPAALFDQLDTNRDGFLSRGEVEPLGLPAVGAAPPAESAAARFLGLDTNRDGFLSRAEAGSTFDAIPGGSFNAFDTNRDGFLNMAEAVPHLQWLQNRSPAVHSFAAFDLNRDGFLSRSEAEPLLSSGRMGGGSRAVTPMASFDRLDLDGDGFLTRMEAAPFMNPATFERFDANRDGFLSRSEADPMFRSSVGGTEGSYGGAVYGPR